MSTEWRAPSFEVHTNQDPRGLQPIVVDLYKFIQQHPNRAKQQCSEKDDIFYFPPNVVPTTHTVKNGKKNVDWGTNLARHLNDTNCLENGFTFVSNGSRASNGKFADDTPKHHKDTIWWRGFGRIGCKNPDKKQNVKQKVPTHVPTNADLSFQYFMMLLRVVSTFALMFEVILGRLQS